jgi:hypothetical protein
MHGDIKGAFLSDTDATDASVSARNLITNSTFADTSNWTGATNGVLTAPTGLGSYASGTVLRITNTGGANGRAISNTFSTTVGKQYGIRISFTNRSSGGQYRVEIRQSGNDLTPEPGTTTAGYYNYQFISAGTGTYYVELYCLGADGEWAEFDDVYVYELEQDRSVNQEGLQVFGTVTKSAVATGADLVGYSGWSTSNYLMRPYNDSTEDPGSGDWSFIAWVKTSTQHTGILWSIRDPNNTNPFLQVWFDNANGFAYGQNPGGYQSTSITYADNVWHCYVVTKRSGTIYLYQDGTQKGSLTANSDPGLLSTAQFRVGNHYNNLYPVQGSMALMRYSLSAPSPEQIKKIYEDEKVLFQENAACTLHGSSDAVTALAYDEVTEQLHVGTSSGRSDFQGLRRINNTTTAVTTAISAHDEFIVEQ